MIARNGRRTILFHSPVDAINDWRAAFQRHRANIDLLTRGDIADPGAIEYAVVYRPTPDLLDGLARLRALFSISHGLDHLAGVPIPAGVVVVQMQDGATADAIADYAVLAALAALRDWRGRLADQLAGRWRVRYARLARDATVCVLGLGMIGQRVAVRLAANGFRLRAWSRRPRKMENIRCFDGDDGLDAALDGSDVVICVLPLTAQTQYILDERRMRLLAPSAAVVNVGRGGLIHTPSLRMLLDQGVIGAAIIDVFDEEPLPSHDPFWTHPAVTVTAHDAGVAQPDEAVGFILEGIDRIERGDNPRGLVHRPP